MRNEGGRGVASTRGGRSCMMCGGCCVAARLSSWSCAMRAEEGSWRWASESSPPQLVAAVPLLAPAPSAQPHPAALHAAPSVFRLWLRTLCLCSSLHLAALSCPRCPRAQLAVGSSRLNSRRTCTAWEPSVHAACSTSAQSAADCPSRCATMAAPAWFGLECSPPVTCSASASAFDSSVLSSTSSSHSSTRRSSCPVSPRLPLGAFPSRTS